MVSISLIRDLRNGKRPETDISVRQVNALQLGRNFVQASWCHRWATVSKCQQTVYGEPDGHVLPSHYYVTLVCIGPIVKSMNCIDIVTNHVQAPDPFTQETKKPSVSSSLVPYFSHRQPIYDWLVVEPPLWKIWKSVGMMTFPIYGKIKVMFQSPPTRWGLIKMPCLMEKRSRRQAARALDSYGPWPSTRHMLLSWPEDDTRRPHDQAATMVTPGDTWGYPVEETSIV